MQTAPPRLAGTAIVLLRGGHAYEGDVLVVPSSGLVCFSGQRRLRFPDGVEHRPAGDRVWPLREILEIRFLANDSERAAA